VLTRSWHLSDREVGEGGLHALRAAISHLNVLHLYEFEQRENFAYVVTELLEGENAHLTRGPR